MSRVIIVRKDMLQQIREGKCLQYLTSSSAIADRPRDACSTSNRKPVKKLLLLVSFKGLGHFEANFRLKVTFALKSMDR